MGRVKEYDGGEDRERAETGQNKVVKNRSDSLL